MRVEGRWRRGGREGDPLILTISVTEVTQFILYKTAMIVLSHSASRTVRDRCYCLTFVQLNKSCIVKVILHTSHLLIQMLRNNLIYYEFADLSCNSDLTKSCLYANESWWDQVAGERERTNFHKQHVNARWVGQSEKMLFFPLNFLNMAEKYNIV